MTKDWQDIPNIIDYRQPVKIGLYQRVQAIERFGRHDHEEAAEPDSGSLAYAPKEFMGFEVRGAVDQTLGRLAKAALGKTGC